MYYLRLSAILTLALGAGGAACSVPNPNFQAALADAGTGPGGPPAGADATAERPTGGATTDARDGSGAVPGPGSDAGAAGDTPIPLADASADTAAASPDAAAPISYSGDLTRGLIVYLRLDDGPGTVSLRDGAGKGAAANLQSAGENGAWMDGRFARAVKLAGTTWSGWIEIASSNDINTLNGQVTFALWIWREETGGTLVSRRAVGPQGFVYELGLSGDALFARLNTAAAYNVRVMGPAVPAGRWTHVAMTYDAQNVRLYLDGRQVGVAPYQQQLPLENSAVVVGGAQQQNASIGSRFPGRLDEVAIYARALSAADVAALAAGAQPPSR